MLRASLALLGVAGLCYLLLAKHVATIGPCGGNAFSMIVVTGLFVGLPLGSVLLLLTLVAVGVRRMKNRHAALTQLHLK